MLVNIYKGDELNEEVGIYKSSKEKINILDIRNHLLENYLEIIKSENINLITKEIEKYIINNYNIKDISLQNEITSNVINKLYGYDILQKYIDDDNISDIRVTRFDNIYIKTKGKWLKTKSSFENTNEFYEYVRYIVIKNNSNINYENPIIIVSDKKYNLRIEAGISPTNVMSPSLVIRIHRIDKNKTLEYLLIESNMLNFDQYKFLLKIIKEGKNLVLSGKGGSGKTTLLRAIIDKLDDNIAITTNEETAELYLENKNVIQREIDSSRNVNNITLNTLMKHSLVMSNDVIIIGELKGKEALVFFDAISTGHIGLTTIHSNSADQTLDRLTTLIKRDETAQSYKEEFILKMLASSLDYIIYLKNFKIHEITKVTYEKQIVIRKEELNEK